MSHNGLVKISGLENNRKLRVLDLSSNAIEKLENISHLKNLEEFWVIFTTSAYLTIIRLTITS